MKNIYKFFIGSLLLGITSCSEDFIDVQPQSYITEEIYFSNTEELNTALFACYAGMRSPAAQEWKFTELRSDNAVLNQIATTSVDNILFLSYDAFNINTVDPNLSEFWFFNYVNIKNNNILLDKMNVNYSEGSIVYGDNDIDATAEDIKVIASQATFLRAYHYFNLVRLFGDLFLVTEPLSPVEATSLSRADTSLIYELIIADLQNTIAYGNSASYSSISSNDVGKANIWSAKALLAKVYLTLGRKADALTLLQDIIANSGYGLEPSYKNVFSIDNELNREILFTIRYKSGLGNLGSPFTTSFAPALPTRDENGAPVFVVSNQGDNAPGQEYLDSFITDPITDSLNITSPDVRRSFIRKSRDASTPQKLFYTKYWYSLSVRDDSEYDFPIIRYADVLLMYAEAAGNSDPNSLIYINRVRLRAGLGAHLLTAADIDTPAKFELAVANERRWEFNAENHRWYDILRYGTTTTTLNAVDIMENHFTVIHPLLYAFFTQNAEDVTLSILLERVNENSLLLPIPQIELDLDSEGDFDQNPGYN